MKLTMIEAADKELFLEVVNGELALIGDRLFSFKAQRNLYYSLSGSTRVPGEMLKETNSLKEGYIAFIVYRESEIETTCFPDFDFEEAEST
jgi:hypothetical protein